MGEAASTIEVKVVGIKRKTSDVGPWEEFTGILEQKRVECSEQRKKSLRARYLYGILFLLANLVAWCVRDYGQMVSPQLHYLKACGVEGQDCFHTMGVLRVSLGCFIFFFIMFLTTCKTSKLYETRNTWHSRWWSLKFIILVVSLIIPFFVPSDFVQLYGELARVGAGVFLLLQLISIIEFITWWNNYWMPDERRKQSCSLGLFTSTVFYIASVCGIGVMYSLYAPRPSCILNIFFITWTAILLVVMMVISLHSKVNRGLLSSGIMASYIVFLCWSAIRSEPATEKCSPKEHENGHGDWTTVLGFIIAIGAIVIATFSTGIDSQTFQFRKNDIQQDDDIPYKYGFFHLIFSLGAMYFAMLFISWNLDSSARKWSIDVGWASTWVKIVNEWFAATIYLWKLMYPVVRQSKVMDHEEPVQESDNNI
ncbi:Serine incorporator [Actinidia chinensis var. chinensis]|uniref:Serine incorporator n=1 Tax=Actinidia chinensis var. chinensis TaxID=1590841 RepID=A0A2R6S0B0_ACTCC|nr:Serine incorporator [Actinidia chinensis var. chinensis]